METSEIKQFECPPGFTKEDLISNSPLNLEDLDDDCELWLVRLPSDADPTILDNTTITLDGESNFIKSDSCTYECVAERGLLPGLCLVLPDPNEGKLVGVCKEFKGNVFINEHFGDVVGNKVEERHPVLPQLEKKSKRHEHSVSEDNIELGSQIEDNIPALPQSDKKDKKSKKKHERSVSEEMEQGSQIEDNVPVLTQSDKKDKKSKKKHQCSVSEEDMEQGNQIDESIPVLTQSGKKDKKPKKKHETSDSEENTEIVNKIEKSNPDILQSVKKDKKSKKKHEHLVSEENMELEESFLSESSSGKKKKSKHRKNSDGLDMVSRLELEDLDKTISPFKIKQEAFEEDKHKKEKKKKKKHLDFTEMKPELTSD